MNKKRKIVVSVALLCGFLMLQSSYVKADDVNPDQTQNTTQTNDNNSSTTNDQAKDESSNQNNVQTSSPNSDQSSTKTNITKNTSKKIKDGLHYNKKNRNYYIYKNNKAIKGYFKYKKAYYQTTKTGKIVGVRNPAKVISQLPQLPTGCEMTAVTMMINYAGMSVSKFTVANETPRSSNGNYGFVGSPYKKTGWWVYPSGIAPVVRKNLGKAKIMTGCSIKALHNQLIRQHLVVVWIANMNGFVNHAITLTGFDANKRIHYNNPWTGKAEVMSQSSFYNHWKANKKRALSY